MDDLQNRQIRQLRNRLEAIGTAGEILRVSLGTSNLEDAVRTILLGLSDLVPCRAAGIFAVEADRLVELGCVLQGEFADIPPVPRPLLQGHPVADALLSNRHQILPDVESLLPGEEAGPAVIVPFEGRLGAGLDAGGPRASHLLWIDSPESEIDGESLDTMLALASQAGVILTGFRYRDDLERTYKALQTANNRLQKDIDRARRIQEGLLPLGLPDLPGLSAASRYQPAEKVSGDYFDCFPVDPSDTRGIHCLVMADVSGHGISAAMVMAMFKVLLRKEVRAGRAPSDVLGRMNRMLIEQIRGLHYVTVFLGYLDPASGALEWCSAGHCPQLLVRTSGEIEILAADGLFVGSFDDLGATDQKLSMAPGDTLVLYTDGITEAEGPGGDLFEIERLADAVRQARDRDAAGMLDAALAALERFAPGLARLDDLTLFAART